METNNSCGKYNLYLHLVEDLYRDIAECYGVGSKTERIELLKLAFRFSEEGMSFLTKTLPLIGKAVDTALATGTCLSIEGLTKPPGTVIPHFLGWLLGRVFDVFGYELDQPDPIALKHFRQIVYLVYKLEIPYEQETAQAVIDSFVQTETDLRSIQWDAVESEYSDWLDDARDLVTRVVSPIDPVEVSPRHGPGAVATGERVLEKSFFSRIYSELERVYPFMEYMRYNLNHVAEATEDDQRRLKIEAKATAKVVLVPKDSRGPRLISCEPLEIQWIQQGLGRLLQQQIESSRHTRGFVNFTNQQVNRDLALEGSRTKQWATLDMKEASDRVSCRLVARLFEHHPRLLEAMMACRSEGTLLPNGTVIDLEKFAPMGSALCFPVEALVFWALSVSAIRRYNNRSRRKAAMPVYVYGDDIIVKEKDYATLLQYLPKVGLLFNKAKCCTDGSFKESCGCDAFKGVDVTPIRLKTVWSHRRTDPRSLESYVAFHNAMIGLGHYRVAGTVAQMVVSLYGLIPFTNRFTVAPNGAYVSLTRCPAFVSYEPAHVLNNTSIATLEDKTDLKIRSERAYRQKLRLQFRNGGVDPANKMEGPLTSTEKPPVLLNGQNLSVCYSGVDRGVVIHRGLRTRYNYELHQSEVYALTSVPKKVSQRKLRNSSEGYAELLRRTSAGFGPHGGSYALVRSNCLKRTWTSV